MEIVRIEGKPEFQVLVAGSEDKVLFRETVNGSLDEAIHLAKTERVKKGGIKGLVFRGKENMPCFTDE